MAIKIALYSPPEIGVDATGGPGGSKLPNLPAIRYIQLTWDFPTNLTKEAGHLGFEAVIHTGSDPTDVTSWLQPSQIFHVTNIREAEFSLPAPRPSQSSQSVNGSVRAIYKIGDGPWDTADPGTVGTAPSTDLAVNDLSNISGTVAASKLIAKSTITSDRISSGGAPGADNLFPNSNSGAQPTATDDPTSPEFAGIPVAGIGSPNGLRVFSWTGAVNAAAVTLDVPCNAGDEFIFTANVPLFSGTNNLSTVDIRFVKDGVEVAPVSSFLPPIAYLNVGPPLASPAPLDPLVNLVGMQAVCPSDSVNRIWQVRFRIMTVAAGTGSVSFGNLYARKIITAGGLDIEPSSGNLLPNASFDADTNGDGMPDAWGYTDAGSEPITATFILTGGADADVELDAPGGSYVTLSWSSDNTQRKDLYTDVEMFGGVPGLTFFGTSGASGVRGGWRVGVWYVLSIYAKATGTNIGQPGPKPQWFDARDPNDEATIYAPVLTADWQRYIYKVRWNEGVVDDPTVDSGQMVNGRMTWTFTGLTHGSISYDQAMVAEADIATAWQPGTSRGGEFGSSMALAALEHQYVSMASGEANSRVFYRGQNDPGTNGGAPNPVFGGVDFFFFIQNLFAGWLESGTTQIQQFAFGIVPSPGMSNLGGSDNFESMRYVELQFYFTATDLTPFRKLCVAINDRCFHSPTDTDSTNGFSGNFSLMFADTTLRTRMTIPDASNLYIQARLWNAYGSSAWMDFSPPGVAGPGTGAPITPTDGANYPTAAGGSVIVHGQTGGASGSGGAAGIGATPLRSVPTR